jgi:hypothetical protein
LPVNLSLPMLLEGIRVGTSMKLCLELVTAVVGLVTALVGAVVILVPMILKKQV